MAYRLLPIQLLLLNLLWCMAFTTNGAEVYKWIGADGTTHYSEAPPVNQPVSIKKISIRVHTPEPAAQPTIQNTLEVAKQLEASRLEYERLRLDKKMALIERQRILAEQTAREESWLSVTGPVYYVPVHRRHRTHKPFHHRHRSNAHKPVHHRPSRPHRYRPASGHQYASHPVTIPPKPSKHRPVRPRGKQGIKQARMKLPRQYLGSK